MSDKIEGLPWAQRDAAKKDYDTLKARGVKDSDKRNLLLAARDAAMVAVIGISNLDKFEKFFAWLETLSSSNSQKQLLGELKKIPSDQLDREYILHNLTVGANGANIRRSPYVPLDNKSGENAVVAHLEKDVIVPRVVKVYGKNPDVPGKLGIWYAILDFQGDQPKKVVFTYGDNLAVSEAERPIAANKKTITLNP